MVSILRAFGVCSLVLAVGAASAATLFETAVFDPTSTSRPPLVLRPMAARLDDCNAAVSPADGKFVELSGCDETDLCDLRALDCGPVWTARIGAVILDRSKPEGDTIARPAGGLLSVSAGGDFDFAWDGGVDVYLARQFVSGCGVEMRYFNVDSHAGFDYGNAGDLDIADRSVFNLFDVDAAYASKLNSTELNLRMPTSSRVTWLAGARWIELHEKLNYDVDLLLPINNDFNWNTDNHIYGGQLGADLQLWDLKSPLSINSVLKAGIYGNNADNHFGYHVANIPVLEGGAEHGDVAFVGDIGINVSYQVTRHFALTGGYQLLWINGAALASDQAALTLQKGDLDVITTQGDLFYHGALTAAVFSW